MKKKILFLLFFYCYTITFLAQKQDINIYKLEKIADSLFYDLELQYSNKKYKDALDLREEILLTYKDTSVTSYRVALAKMYATKSALFAYNSSYDSAIYYSEKALKITKKLKKKNLFFEGFVMMHLYEQVAYNGDWKESMKLCNKTLQIFRDTLPSNHEIIAGVEFDKGYVAGVLGDYTTQLKQYEISKDKFISYKGENNYDVAIKYNHLAGIYETLGYYKKELESYKNAAKIWGEIDYEDKSYLSTTYGSLSTWYLQHGDYKKAEQYLIKNEKLIERYKDGKWYNETFKGRTQLSVWRSYADLYQFKKETDKAIFYSDKIINYLNNFDVNDKKNNPNNIRFMESWVAGRILLSLRFKASLIKKDNPEKATEIYKEIISRRKTESSGFSTATESINLGNYYLKKKLYLKAEETINEELSYTLSKKRNVEIIELMALQATIYNEQDSLLKMDRKYNQMFKRIRKDTLQEVVLRDLKYEDCKPIGDQSIINLLLKASRNYKDAYVKTNTIDYLKTSHNLNIIISEIFSENFATLDYNDKTYDKVIEINEQLLETTIMQEKEGVFDDILQNIEESNSRMSWKKFLNSNQRKNIDIPESVLEKEENLKVELQLYKKSLFLSDEKDDEKTNLWKEKIFDLEKERDSLSGWYRENYTSYFNQTQKDFRVESVKKKLKNNQKIIKYIFAKKNVYAFVITKSETNLIKIGEKIVLIQKIKSLIQSLTKTTSESYKSEAAEVYKVLFPKQILDENDQELIFILDDVLHFLPMEILINNKGKYIIETSAVSYAPSLLLWNEQLKVKKSKNLKLGVFAPIYKAASTDEIKNNGNIELIGANNEAIRISKIFNADIFIGSDANKKHFIKHANSYNLLHLAMHSTINDVDSEFSNLDFSSGNEEEKLYISELYNMSFNADLVVLSACNTAIGNVKKGEGPVNVSKAFTYAGVPSTVTSLWKVPDKETAQIMVSFYTYLKEGKSKNNALQLAKLDYLNSVDDDLLKHPYYWAGFVISGDISAINTTNNSKIIWIVLGGTLFFIVALKRYRKKTKKVA